MQTLRLAGQMLETGQLENGAAPIFDPFTCAFILPVWHGRIQIVPAPEVSRVYGRTIEGGPCCLWTGWSNGKGHGAVRIKEDTWKRGDGRGRRVYLHRHSYEKHHGISLFPSQAVDHLCRNRPCFNPYHLECTSHLENHLRGDGVSTQFKPKDQYGESTVSDEDIAALASGLTGDYKYG